MDEEQLAERELEAALWYVKHKVRLRQFLVGALIVLDSVLIIYGVFGLGQDLVSSPQRKSQDRDLINAEIPGRLTRATVTPQELQLGGVELLTSGNIQDVVARLMNPNSRWSARFEYTIGLGDKVERRTDGFLLPGEGRPFIFTARAGVGALVFNLERVLWRRIDPHEIPEVAVWRNDHLNFEVRDAQFLPAVVEGQGAVGRARLTITNKSSYGYAEPKFLVLLYRAARLVGVQYLVVEQFRSGQERLVELSWFDRIGAVSNIEVLPEIDILDPRVYMKP